MTFEAALKYTARLVLEKSGKKLSDTEIAILRAAWNKRTYGGLAEETNLTETNLKAIGHKLWILMTACFEEPVGKVNFHKAIEKRLKANSVLTLSTDALSSSIDSQKKLNQSNREAFTTIRGCQQPDVSDFLGRGAELSWLMDAINNSQCVSIIGIAGIGKSALAARLVEKVFNQRKADDFEICIWKSGYYPTYLSNLLYELLDFCGVDILDADVAPQVLVSQLIQQMRQKRILLVLDGIEDLTKVGHDPEYSLFLRRLAEETHKSCALFTTQVPLSDLDYLKSKGHHIVSLKLKGLGDELYTLLEAKGLKEKNEWDSLIEIYRGNPLIVKLVANRIREYFGGKVKGFLSNKSAWLASPIKDNLLSLIQHLTFFEKQILIVLAERLQTESSISIPQLQGSLDCNSISDLVEGIERLHNLSLIERSQNGEILLMLQPVIKKFVYSHSEKIQNLNHTLKSSA